MRNKLLFILTVFISYVSSGQSLGPVFDVFNKGISFDIPANVQYYYDSTSSLFGNQILTINRELDAEGFLHSATGKYLSVSPFGNDTIDYRSSSVKYPDSLVTLNFLFWTDGSSDTSKETIVYENSIPQKFIVYDKPEPGSFTTKYIVDFTYTGGKITNRRINRRSTNTGRMYLYSQTKYYFDNTGKHSHDSIISYLDTDEAMDTTVAKYTYNGNRLQSYRTRVLSSSDSWFQNGVPVYNNKGQVEEIRVYQNYSIGDTTIPAQISRFYDSVPLALEETGKKENISFTNPFHGSFTVLSEKQASFDITNLNGELLVKGTSGTEVNTESLSAGVYLLRIKTGSGIQTEKVIKY